MVSTALFRLCFPSYSGSFLHSQSCVSANISKLLYSSKLLSFVATFKLSYSSAEASDLRFDYPLKIVEYPDPILTRKTKRVVTFDKILKKLVCEMFGVMYRLDGCGLSAPQVGVGVQVMVLKTICTHKKQMEIAVINPRVHGHSAKKVILNEGCLSFPGIFANVKRPACVDVEASDVNGTKISLSLTGFPARVFQHEFDHLQGILFIDRMTKETRDNIQPKLLAG